MANSIDELIMETTNKITDEDRDAASRWLIHQRVTRHNSTESNQLIDTAFMLCAYLMRIVPYKESTKAQWNDFLKSNAGFYYAALHGYLDDYILSDFTDKASLVMAYKMLSIFQLLVLQAKRTKTQVAGSKGGLAREENSFKNHQQRNIETIQWLLLYLEKPSNLNHIELINELMEKDFLFCQKNKIKSYRYPLDKYIKDCTGKNKKLNLGLCGQGRRIKDSVKWILKEIIQGRKLGSFYCIDELPGVAFRVTKKHKLTAEKLIVLFK